MNHAGCSGAAVEPCVFTWDIAAGLPVVLDDGDARYVYGAGGLISQVTVADTYYYLPDGLGSTMVTTNSAGNVANAYTYDVFGAPRSTSGAQANDFQFAGEQVDGSTGLQYLRARYYDFEVGRFMSRDPLSALPAWNQSPYAYADANPTRFVDRLGWCWGPDIRCSVQDGAIRVGGKVIARGAGGVTTLAHAIANGASWLLERGQAALAQLGGQALSALQQTLELIKMIGEYAFEIARGCVRNPFDCAVALEHILLGVGMVALGAGIISLGCTAGEVLTPVVCGVSVVTGATVMVAGAAVAKIGTDELLALRRGHRPGAH